MRTHLATASAILALPLAVHPVTHPRKHLGAYERAYHAVAHKLGTRAPGRNIGRFGLPDGRRASDARLLASLAVLARMLNPAPAPAYPQAAQASTTSSPTTSATPSSGLAACIISRESGGDPQATNGQYTGIAQWSPSSWAGGGGTRYAPTPTGASAAQQIAVLDSMLASGQAGQWTPYDGC